MATAAIMDTADSLSYGPGGNTEAVVSDLQGQMEEAAEALDFERAAQLEPPGQ